MPEEETIEFSGMLRREAIKEGSFMQQTRAGNLLGTHQNPFIHIIIIDGCHSLEAPTFGACHRQACLRHASKMRSQRLRSQTCWGHELMMPANGNLHCKLGKRGS